MFMLPLGLICGSLHYDEFDVTVGDIFVKNMIPVTLGNLFAGAVCVAASYSYAFGKLGQTACGAKDNCSCFTVGCDCVPTKKALDVESGATQKAAETVVEVTPKQKDVEPAK